MKNKLRDICQALAIASALIVPAVGMADGRGDDRGGGRGDDDPPFQQLSAQWWQWALSIPTTDNPLADVTGEKCMVGQRGPIWFLAGLLAPGTISRSCRIPQGTTLFFPVANLVQVNTPGECGQTDPVSVADIRAVLSPIVDKINIKTATLDGIAVRGISRVRSVPFAVALPVDNLFVAPCASQSPSGQRAGVFSPAADDGYYVKIEGLRAGVHVLQFTAKSPDGFFDNNVTYHLTVVPVSLR